jgi:hypothetical protein
MNVKDNWNKQTSPNTMANNLTAPLFCMRFEFNEDNFLSWFFEGAKLELFPEK